MIQQRNNNGAVSSTSLAAGDLMRSQTEKIEQMLQAADQEQSTIIWKILIYDEKCQALMSTLFRVGHLRERNVTLLMGLHSQRERLFGVKALYFIEPTEQNLNRIADDFKNDLYDNVYVNFVSPIDRNLFEKFAVRVGKSNSLYKVKKVLQHDLLFISLGSSLFSFNISGAYADLFISQQQQQQGEAPQQVSLLTPRTNTALYRQIATHLYCLCRTMNIHPLIYYQAAYKASKSITDELSAIFAESARQRENGHAQQQSDQAPLIAASEYNGGVPLNQPSFLIVERDFDLGSLLLHPLHYGALLHDVLGIRNNKVSLNNAITNNKAVVYDLDPLTDRGWAEKMNQPFPDVATQNAREIEQWQQDYNAMSHRQKPAANSEVEQLSASLSDALDQLPDMTEKKKRIDAHTNLSTHVLNEIRKRALDVLFEIGSSLVFRHGLQSQERKQLRTHLEKGESTEEDRLRLLLLYMIFEERLKIKDLEDLVEVAKVKDAGNLQILAFFRQKLGLSSQSVAEESKEGNGEAPKTNNVAVPAFIKNLADRVKTKGKDLLLNVQDYIPKGENRFLLAHLVHSMVESKCNSLRESGFSVLDVAESVHAQNAPKNRNFNDFYVFVVEGGNYNEYENVCEVAKKFQKNIYYGGCTLLNAEDYLKQLKTILKQKPR